MLTEVTVKGWLAAAGLAVPPSRLVTDPDAAAAAAAQIGYPVVLKAQAAALPHKSEQGVLALGLRSAAEVRAAWDRIWPRAQEAAGAAGVDGVLVEKMMPAGFEMLVGVTRHQALGPFLTVGAGGAHAEVFRDVEVLPAPATPAQVRAAVSRLRCGSALHNSAVPLDAAAFCDLAARVSQLAAGAPELAELDLNPVIVHPAGAGASIADALAVRRG